VIALRLISLAIVIALGTMLAGWWAVPVAGIAYGALAHRTAWPSLVAAAAGALAWGGYVSLMALGGASVGSFGARVSASMGLPSYGMALATMLFPAIVAGIAAALGARLRPAGSPALRRAG
jgi:hypothetical protein